MRFLTKLKFLRLAFYFSLLLVLILTACGGDSENSDADETNNNNGVPIDTSLQDLTEVPTSRPVNPTLPPANSTLPPAVTDAPESEVEVTEQGTIRVVNVINDLPQVDVFIDGESVERRLEIYSASRHETQLSVGTHQVSVVESTSSDSSAVVYFEGEFDIQEDNALLIVLGGTTNNILFSVFEEDLSPVAPGQSRIMFVNALADVSSAQLVEGSALVIDDVAFGSISNPVEVVARDHIYSIEEGDGGFLTSFEREMESGFGYTVVLAGDLANDIITFMILEAETPPQTRVRITHAAPDVLALDILFDSEVLAENLSFGETLDFQTLPSKFYDVQIFDSASGTSSTPLLENRLNLREYESVEVVIYGQDNDLGLASHTIDTAPIPVGFSRLVVFHAAIGESGIRFVGPDDSELGLSVRYGEFSRPLLIDVGSIEFRFGTGNQDDPQLVEAPVNPINMEEGTSYSYIVTGRTDENPLFLTYDVRLVSQPEEITDGGGGTRVSVRAINALNDNEEIRVELDDTQITTRLQQYRISSSTSIESGFHIIRVYNSSDALLYESELSLEEFRAFTIVVSGQIPDVQAVLQSDFTNIPLGEAIVRYVHASPNLPRVIIDYRPVSGNQNLDPGVVATPTDEEEQDDYSQEISYAEVSVSIQINAGLSEFSLINRETFEPIVTFSPQDLVGGRTYDILLVPGANSEVELLIIDHGQE